jgi:hypothetical protein
MLACELADLGAQATDNDGGSAIYVDDRCWHDFEHGASGKLGHP